MTYRTRALVASNARMPDLLFSILGNLEARRIGEPAPVRLGERAEQLLARLLLDGNRSVSVERLLEDLWGEEGLEPEQAVNTVQVTVARLRRALGDGGRGIVSTTNTGYELVHHDHAVDSVRFGRLARMGHALRDQRPRVATILLSEALSTWRGPLLGTGDLPRWAQPTARELDRLYDSAEIDHNAARLALGDLIELEGALHRQLVEHPLDERRHRQLVQTLAAAGRVAEAGAHFREAYLAMGTVSAEFRQLAERIGRGDVPASPGETVSHGSYVAGAILLHAAGSTSRPHGPGLGTLALLLEEAGGSPCPDGRSAMMAVFPDPAVAITTARLLADHPLLRCAVGLHAGAALWAQDRIRGAGAERCRLIAAAASPGQVLVSQAVRRRIGPGTELVDLGVHRFDDLLVGEPLFTLPAATPADAFPVPATLSRGPHNLPVQPARFIGRSEELSRLAQWVATGELISIVGPGGFGKSRLALQLAARSAPAFSDGVWFASLAELAPEAGEDDLAMVIAAAIGARCIPVSRATETLIAHLADRHLLLIVDNCEHVIESCRALLVEVLARCAYACLVVTSRHRMRLDGERILLVPGMRTTADHSDISDAVELLLERAGCPVPAPEELAVAAALCAALEGSPLAIELVAAQVATRGVTSVAAEVGGALTGGRELGALSSDDPRRPERQRTIEATIGWSHALLTPEQRAVLRQMAIFHGSFGLEEALAVVDAGDGGTVTSLVDHSMVAALPAVDGVPRFRLEMPIRAFALEELRRAGELEHARERHIAAYLALAARVAPSLFGAGERHALIRFQADHENFRAVLAALAEDGRDRDALGLVCDLWWWWFSHGHLDEGADWVRRALALGDGASPLRVRALRAGSHLTWWRGDYAQTARYNAELEECAQAVDDRWGLAWAPMAHGALLLFRDPVEALPLFEDSHRRFRELGHDWESAYALQLIGGACWFAGDLETAEEAFVRATQAVERLGHVSVLASVRRGAGMMSALLGRAERGAALCHQALTLSERVGDRSGSAQALNFLGAIARTSGAPDVAAERHARALRYAREVGDLWATCAALDAIASLACAAGDLRLAVRLRTHSDTLASRSAYRRSGPEAQMRDDDRVIEAGLATSERETASAEGELMETGEAVLSALAFVGRKGNG